LRRRHSRPAAVWDRAGRVTPCNLSTRCSSLALTPSLSLAVGRPGRGSRNESSKTTAKNARVDARERHLWLVKRGGSLGGLDFGQGVTDSLPGGLDPLHPLTQLARSSAAPDQRTAFAPSHPELNKPQIPAFFPRNVKRNPIRLEKWGNRGRFRLGGWSHNRCGPDCRGVHQQQRRQRFRLQQWHIQYPRCSLRYQHLLCIRDQQLRPNRRDIFWCAPRFHLQQRHLHKPSLLSERLQSNNWHQ
jgi:hypothetical protein